MSASTVGVPATDRLATGFLWLASYPKSGNTWFRTLLWALDHPGPVDRPIELDELGSGPIASDRRSFDERTGLDSGSLPPDVVEELRPRAHRSLLTVPGAADGAAGGVWVRKAHDAYARTPGGASLFPVDVSLGAVYLVRNPLDVCVSYAHHQGGADLDEVIRQMADPLDAMAGARDRHMVQLPQRLGGWSHHVTSWLDQTDIPVSVVRYEDLHDPDPVTFAAVFARCGRHVGPDEVVAAFERCRFERVAAREAASGFRERAVQATSFFREGRAGGWRAHLTDRQAARLIADHGTVMRRLGYLDDNDEPGRSDG